MQKLLSRRIEAWVVATVLLIGVLSVVLTAILVADGARQRREFGVLGAAAFQLANLPSRVFNQIAGPDPRIAVRTADFADKPSGWASFDTSGLTGYLLLSRYDGDEQAAAVDLVDLSDLSVRHRWTPDPEQLLDGARPGTVTGNGDTWNSRFFEAVHPLLMPDGGLVLKDNQSPLLRIDACDRLVWREEGHIHHHAMNFDADGAIWSNVHFEPQHKDVGDRMHEDGIVQLSPDGVLLQEFSLYRILQDNGLLWLGFGGSGSGFRFDPLHLNDVEPVLSDGPYWRRGDLFLSMRHASAVLLFRPSTGRVIWMRQGPWLGQHDVDILGDHEISVYNNNAYDFGKGARVQGANEVLIYDFATDKFSSPLQDAMASNGVRTFSEGLDDRTASGHTIVEEENSGRILVFDPHGKLSAEFVNRDSKGRIYTTSWVRYVDRADGDRALAALETHGVCP